MVDPIVLLTLTHSDIRYHHLLWTCSSGLSDVIRHLLREMHFQVELSCTQRCRCLETFTLGEFKHLKKIAGIYIYILDTVGCAININQQ